MTGGTFELPGYKARGPDESVTPEKPSTKRETRFRCTSPATSVSLEESENLLDVRSLSGICHINLGEHREFGSLYASPIAAVGPDLSGSDLFELLLPEWWRDIDGYDKLVEAQNGIKEGLQKRPGLFFGRKNGYYFDVLALALLTLRGRADVLDLHELVRDSCVTTPEDLRKQVEKKRNWLRMDPNLSADWINLGCRAEWETLTLNVTSDGTVIPSRSSTDHTLAWTAFGNVHLCPIFRLEAALADYYMHWAKRLVKSALYGIGGTWDFFMAILCARCALTEIVDLAAVILHEVTHLQGSQYECSRIKWRFYDGVFRGTSEGLRCCHFMHEYIFRNCLWADYGLPPSHLCNGVDNDTAAARFNFELDAGWRTTLNGVTNCSGASVTGFHSSLLAVPHDANIMVVVNPECDVQLDERTSAMLHYEPEGGYSW